MLTSSSLLAGGFVAAAVAMWGQVKSVASYLTSFAVVSMSGDESLSNPLHQYIRTNFKLLPSGQLRYIGRYITLRGRKNTSIVPFKTTPATAIYRNGWRFMVVTMKSDGISITTLRGMFNFNALISTAIDAFENRIENVRGLKHKRFQVIRVIGSEKSASSRDSRAAVADAPERGSNGIERMSEGHWTVDLSIDTSFKYPMDMYADNIESDPFENLFFDPEIVRYVEQARQWMEMGEWYIERGIPYRRGWMLYGEGGTGKSSLAKGTAQALGIPIYHYYLATLSDQEFLREWEGMATPCVALFEDFDNVFHLRESQTEHKLLTFDCVLNAISGVSSINGVFLMVTTNHLELVDPAMGVECGRDGISTRPGRIDSVIKVGRMSRENRYRLARKILRDWPEDVERLVEKSEGMTPIQLQELCIQTAFDHLSRSQIKPLKEAA